MLREDYDTGISHICTLISLIFFLCFVLFIRPLRCSLWPFRDLIFKYFISQSPPSPSSSHSAVLAHFSCKLISIAFSNSALPPLCSAHSPFFSFLSIILDHNRLLLFLYLDTVSLHLHSLSLYCFMPLMKRFLVPFCVNVTKPVPYPTPVPI